MIPLLKRLALALLNILQIAFAAILAGLQFMDKVEKNSAGEPILLRWELWNYVIGQRFIITVTGFIALGLAALFKDYLSRPSHVTDVIRQTIMEAMLEECFENDRANVRITIFKEAGFWHNRWIYIKRAFSHLGGWKTPHHSYIYVWDRLGKPKSKICFRYSDKAEKLCEGVAGVVRHLESNLEIPNLPNIDHIDLKTLNIKSTRLQNAKVVRGYTKESYIRNFESLKQLNRKSRHIYANVLTNERGEIKGVLVIDSCAEIYPLNDEVLQNIPYYLKIIASTI